MRQFVCGVADAPETRRMPQKGVLALLAMAVVAVMDLAVPAALANRQFCRPCLHLATIP